MKNHSNQRTINLQKIMLKHVFLSDIFSKT